MTGELKTLRIVMAWALVTSSVLVMILLQASKIVLDYASMGRVGLTLALLAGTAVVCRKRGFIKSSLIMEALAGGIAFSVLVLISTYLAISLDAPLADDSLAAMDRAMGFDGAAFIRLVDGVPWLSWALMHAYASFAMQLLVLPMLLILFGKPSRAFALVLAYALVGFVSSLISIWFPALGTHVVYAIDPASLKSINPYFGHAFLAQFNAVREQSEFFSHSIRPRAYSPFPRCMLPLPSCVRLPRSAFAGSDIRSSGSIC
ncbi:phosphatase PAP2 family protein [Hoeflea sp. G2-23]|uniref:Phosphatase PAP2 family protein n=1 Tax=Hoeflea algicola TaxID=2983763 RepID=A0ABT3Z852_9HYPH|nr:phosphatase PAP2 family protein [Hoeflea algicola]MCY0147958.1 phosphatase PAP2 family protein [Hoeflea algicola]